MSNKRLNYDVVIMTLRQTENLQIANNDLCGTRQHAKTVPLSCAGHVLRKLDLSYLTHHRPLVWGDGITFEYSIA